MGSIFDNKDSSDKCFHRGFEEDEEEDEDEVGIESSAFITEDLTDLKESNGFFTDPSKLEYLRELALLENPIVWSKREEMGCSSEK